MLVQGVPPDHHAMSDWKYRFPHVWDRPCQVWEDVYLLPDDPVYVGPGLHLTVDAFGNVFDRARR